MRALTNEIEAIHYIILLLLVGPAAINWNSAAISNVVYLLQYRKSAAKHWQQKFHAAK